MPFVYIIQNRISKKHYTGSCLDLYKRINRHKNHTGGRTTSSGELEILCYKEFKSLEEARAVEKLIKKYKGGNGFKKVIEEWGRG